MFVKSLRLGLLSALLLAASTGCKREPASDDQPGSTNQKSKIKNQNSSAPAPSSAPLLRIHWLGKKRLATETNAAYFMTIWNLPESGRLEAQTLDKLALWLANARPALSNYQEITNYSPLVSSNATASTLRPLVQDLLQEEWLLEIQQPTNQPSDLALAIRLDDQRAAAWQAAQATVRDALGALHHATCAVTLTNSGAWTLLGLTESPGTNSALSAFKSEIAASGNPFPASPINYWLEANIDLQQLFDLLGGRASPRAPSQGTGTPTGNTGLAGTLALPRIALTLIGDGENVRTRAEFEFPPPLHLDLDAWNIPTNLIHDPLIGFTAVRGIRPLLKNFKPWNDLQLGTPPNQAYFWAQNGAPWLHFTAFPCAEASDQVSKLADFALNRLNPIFETNPVKLGEFVEVPGSQRLGWRGLPFILPNLDSFAADGTSFIFGGFYPNRLTNSPLPAALLPQFNSSTNLVYYDWEITGPCVQGLTPIAQLVRRLFNRPRLPGEPAIAWLTAIPSKLGNSATAITWTGPTRLSFVRKSSMGLTAAELELLVDWLQSPTFPYGLHTFTSQLPLSAQAKQAGE